jgi:Anti-sigma-28 factor, FlgM
MSKTHVFGGIQVISRSGRRRGNFMSQTSEQRLAELKQKIDRGEYVVDPWAIADALVERLRAASFRAHESQKECSYPDSSSSASVNTMPARPSRTRPTHVTRWLSSTLTALGGMQTQSS